MKVVRNIASRVHCKGDVATQQTYRRCSFHVIPILCRDDRLEAKKRRKRRVDFVKTKRAKREREPSRSSLICSMLFKPNDFVQRLDFLEEEGTLRTPWLKQDELGKNRFSMDSCRSNLINSS